MKKKYDVTLNSNIAINSITVIIANIILKIISVMVIILSFSGKIGRTADKFYSMNGIGISKLIYLAMHFGLVMYVIKLAIDFFKNKRIKLSISEFIYYTFASIVALNYGAYFAETNDKKVIYLLIICMVISLITILVKKISEYNFWKTIYTEGIKVYGENFNDYHSVEVELGKDLNDKEKLDICINRFNFGDCIVISLINLKNYFFKFIKL